MEETSETLYDLAFSRFSSGNRYDKKPTLTQETST